MTENDAKNMIAERLRESRRLSGLSQGQAAKRIGMHRPTISEIEAGNRRVSADELTTFAKLYRVSTTWLMGEGAAKMDIHDAKIELAARELQKMKPQDLDRLLQLLASMREEE